MNIRKQLRRERAFERFNVMTFEQWRKKNGMPAFTDDTTHSLGHEIAASEYGAYVDRKSVEERSLRATLGDE